MQRLQIKNWSMTYDTYEKLSCTVPCSMYSVLLEHGLMKDPYYRMNEQELTGLSDRGCRFESYFELGADLLAQEYKELVFYGLDTICAIYVNGRQLDCVDDMHITYIYDIDGYLQLGKNQIVLEFSSPTQYFKEQNAKHYLWTNGEARDETIRGASHLRKALYMSGWDWGPKLPDMGIFRQVELRFYNEDQIEDVMVLQHHGDDVVELELQVSTAQGICTRDGYELYAEIDGQRLLLPGGEGCVTIRQPKLWWIRGYGDQQLYDLTVTLEKDGCVLDTVQKKIGLRTLTVSTEADRIGREFCFVLNGVKIFAMGANYIPQDSILSRITPQRTKKLIESCLDANFNCLRVWGGGYYPEDEFYELCDQYGLLVWQDFMSACINVRLTERFEQNFVREAICNVKRIRHHASLGLLCGNNEMEDMVLNDPAVGNSELVKKDYLRLYEELLPEICEKYAPQTFYWPSSPSSGGGFDYPQDPLRGDVHYWSVWHGGIPFTDYRNHTFRFCSEYGFESFPSVKTINIFTEAEDRNIFSRVMEHHQKCRSGNGKIMSYMSDTYRYPTRFEDIIYASQLLQADAIKYGVEHFRRNRGICMGSIYWQFNDCWPVASWSSVDYYGRYKALHYAAKKFYAPVAMGLFLEHHGLEEKRQLAVNVSNETKEPFEGRVVVRMCRNDCSMITERQMEVTVPALTSEDVYTMIPEPEDVYSNYICARLYDREGRTVMEQTELFVPPKHYAWRQPQIRVTAVQETEASRETVPGKLLLQVQADCFAKGVYLDFKDVDCILSENFFDLTDRNPKVIRVQFMESETEKGLTAEELVQQVIIKSVYDI